MTRLLVFTIFFFVNFYSIDATESIPYHKKQYQDLSDAIRNKKQVVLIYNGLRREVCPHTLGEKNGKKRVLVYQFAGQSESGLPKEGGWRCLYLNKIIILEIRNGQWYTGKSHTQPQTCIDHIEVVVDY